MALRRAVALLLCSASNACAGRSVVQETPCEKLPPLPGRAAAELRLSGIPDTARRNRGLGGLAVRVHSGTEGEGHPPLFGAQVLVFDTMPASGSAVRRRLASGMVDTSGFFVFDSLPSGVTTLHIRRLGFETQQRAHTIRAGFTDTLIVDLAPTRVCIVSFVPPFPRARHSIGYDILRRPVPELP